MIISIKSFCDNHGACLEGRKWALANCKTMADAWRRAKPEWLIWIATREGVLSDKQNRLFACWCARHVWHLLTDERSRNAIRVAERFARGRATREELVSAKCAAEDAARDDAWSAASGAAWGSAIDAASEAAWYTAKAAAGYNSSYSNWNAAREAQAKYLRKRIGNPFVRKARKV